MDVRAAIEALKARIENTVRPLIDLRYPCALIDFPNYPNVGDSAIYLGELACLHSLGIAHPRFICDFRTYDRAALARAIGSSGTIVLAGGGSFGDLWPTGQELRESIIRSFPTNPIVQLPQTIHFEHSGALRRARDVLNAHRRLTMLVRDRRSLEIAGNEFRVETHLCPDMAFALGPLARSETATRPILWLLRTDKESAAPWPPGMSEARVDWLDEARTPLRALTYQLIRAVRTPWLSRALRPALMRVYSPLARQRLRRGLSMLATARVVVTDRLHGHILSLLLGIPHVVLDNSYGKLSSFYETWTSGIHGVSRADSPAEAAAIAHRLAQELDRGGGGTIGDG